MAYDDETALDLSHANSAAPATPPPNETAPPSEEVSMPTVEDIMQNTAAFECIGDETASQFIASCKTARAPPKPADASKKPPWS